MQMGNIRLMERYWKQKDDALTAQVRANWSAIEKLIAGNPYALNWGPIRPGTERTAGLHPDHAPAKTKKPRANDLDLN